jgi:hypothetical protein
MDDTTRRLALKRAEAVKLVHAQLRAEIRAVGRRRGALRVAEAVRDGDTSMRFFGLLQAIPTVGEGHARQMLGRARISPVARVNSDRVGARQREMLVGQLVGYASRVKGDD